MAEMWVVGNIVFWAILLLWLVIVWALTENDHGFLGFLSTAIYVAVLQFVFKVDVFGWVVSHPFISLLFFFLYFVVGAGWSFWRWYLFVKDKLEPYAQMKAEWLSKKNITVFNDMPDALKVEWATYITDWSKNEVHKTPLVREHRSKITRWIGYWPISFLAWTFNDMIRRFVKIVYENIHDYLQGISNKVFATVKNDFPSDFNK